MSISDKYVSKYGDTVDVIFIKKFDESNIEDAINTISSFVGRPFRYVSKLLNLENEVTYIIIEPIVYNSEFDDETTIIYNQGYIVKWDDDSFGSWPDRDMHKWFTKVKM